MTLWAYKIVNGILVLLLLCFVPAIPVWAVVPEVKIAPVPLNSCSGQSSSSTPVAQHLILSNVAVSNTEITSGAEYLYQAGFYSSRWSGVLKRFSFGLDASGALQLSKTADWDAADILTGSNTQQLTNNFDDKRKAYTAMLKGDNTLDTIEFEWGNLNAAQQAFLNASPKDGANDGRGELRLNYLRGSRLSEQSKQGGIFRIRDRVLGDIVASNVVYVGAPTPGMKGDGYTQFYQTHKVRTKAIYVGANDGMLHGFNADTGAELFSYVPNSVFPVLPQLTQPEYSHRPYVDGMIAVSEARVQESWKTVLVSGLGGGAQGVFALDITAPADFGSGMGALWNFTDNDDPDMGNVMGLPAIGKFRVGMKNGKPTYKYFAVISSGLNNYKDDGMGKYNSSGTGALFLLSLDKPKTEKWELNKNYFKFKTSIKDVTKQNGLSSPALVMGTNEAVRHIYAGDLQGNLWRFDFMGDAPWPQPRRADTPIFVAMDSLGNAQPVTTQPKVVFAPDDGYFVLFGTGKFFEDADLNPNTFRVQSFYGVHDTINNNANSITRSQLELRTLAKDKDGNLHISGNSFSHNVADGGKSGWYFDFLDADKTGERSVSNPVVAYGKIFFNTLITGSNICENLGGRSYALDALTGLTANGESTGYAPQIGLLGSPIVFQIGAKHVASMPTGKTTVQKRYAVYSFGSGGAKGSVASFKNGVNDVDSALGFAKRLSWREIVNWQELRDATGTK